MKPTLISLTLCLLLTGCDTLPPPIPATNTTQTQLEQETGFTETKAREALKTALDGWIFGDNKETLLKASQIDLWDVDFTSARVLTKYEIRDTARSRTETISGQEVIRWKFAGTIILESNAMKGLPQRGSGTDLEHARIFTIYQPEDGKTKIMSMPL